MCEIQLGIIVPVSSISSIKMNEYAEIKTFNNKNSKKESILNLDSMSKD